MRDKWIIGLALLFTAAIFLCECGNGGGKNEGAAPVIDDDCGHDEFDDDEADDDSFPDDDTSDDDSAGDDSADDDSIDDDSGDDDSVDDDSGDDDSADDDTVDDDTTAFIDLVDPFIGTGGLGYGVGAMVPGAIVPFGMASLSPDTTLWGVHPYFDHSAGYYYYDSQIRGFSHMHMIGTGATDLGYVRVMPVMDIDQNKIQETGYRSGFSHSTEMAKPGYYAVTLDDIGVRAELTTTRNVGISRYSLSSKQVGTPAVLMDLGGTIQKDNCQSADITVDPGAREFFGSAHYSGDFTGRFGGIDVYFVARFDTDLLHYGTFAGGIIQPDSTHATGVDAGAYAEFTNFPVQMAVAISFISVVQARANLAAQVPVLDFDAIANAARQAWIDYLSLAQITGGTLEQRKQFATALYHTAMMPTSLTEEGGSYVGIDKNTHSAAGWTYYSNLSLWDTYRTYHPLMSLIKPGLERDFVRSLVAMYEDGGYVPRWPCLVGESGSMIGTSADAVIADSYVRGITDFDASAAYEGCRAHAVGPAQSGRDGLNEYINNGYCAIDVTDDAPSKTLEYVVDDFCLAQLADGLGFTDDRDMFLDRSKNYENIWDPDTQFMRAKKLDGSWLEPFFPFWPFDENYTEGDAWQWSWHVPHDVEGLIALFGSEAAFVQKLNTFFANTAALPNTFLPDPFYWHGNEPDIHAAFMFNYTSSAHLAQKWSRWIMENRYTAGPDGIDGNDDGGTMSSWFVFASMGLYPALCKDLYYLGSPIFDSVTLQLPGGTLIIEAENASSENIYVQSVSFNGGELTQLFIAHSQIVNGGVLHFVMGPNPPTRR